MTDDDVLIARLDLCVNSLAQVGSVWSATVTREALDRLKQLTEVKAPANGSIKVKVAVCVDDHGQGAAVVRTGFASDFDAMRRAREGTMAAKAECIAVVDVPRIHIPAVTSTVEEPK
jgi:hypothetical protein